MAQQNPFGTSGAGANAFKAAYDRLKAEAEARKQGISQDYATAYQQLRQQGYGMGLGAAAQKGLSGGQAAGVSQRVGAQQMGALGNLMQGQERALREAKVGEQSIYSNALLEGQQAQQYQQQQEQYGFQREQQIAGVLANTEYSEETKKAMLKSLGLTDEQIAPLINVSTQPGFLQRLGGTLVQPFNRPQNFGQGVANTAIRTGLAMGLAGPLGQAYNTAGNLYSAGRGAYEFIRNIIEGNQNQGNENQ